MHKSKIIIWNAIMKNDCTSKLFANPVVNQKHILSIFENIKIAQ